MEDMILRGRVNGLSIYRKAGTSSYYVRERVDDPMPSTSVRDLRRWEPIGMFASYEAAAKFVGARLA